MLNPQTEAQLENGAAGVQVAAVSKTQEKRDWAKAAAVSDPALSTSKLAQMVRAHFNSGLSGSDISAAKKAALTGDAVAKRRKPKRALARRSFARQLARENPTWTVRKILGVVRKKYKLGIKRSDLNRLVREARTNAKPGPKAKTKQRRAAPALVVTTSTPKTVPETIEAPWLLYKLSQAMHAQGFESVTFTLKNGKLTWGGRRSVVVEGSIEVGDALQN